MNEGSRAELESLFTKGDGYDPMAGVQITLNLIMTGNAWQDRRVLAIAGRVAKVLCCSAIHCSVDFIP